MEKKRCCECRNSEHEDFSDLIAKTPVVVKDPETNRIVQRGYICTCHADIRRDDGYRLFVNGREI